ncbi:hypothetical protein [Paenibacillus polymyxa]|uniref:hypothetical protein n=1 Tax=Paenibacillus polymyxa TaxID=1406 RepID=UPI002378E350|nr:hypothetical protein [Paenibacillus polymyxa]WDM22064.1 hypothetical protein J4I02_24780 [Paenibacillus polymyxa]
MTEPGDSKQSPNWGFVWFHGKDEGPQIVAHKRDRYPSRMAIFFIFRGIDDLTPHTMVSRCAEVHHATPAKTMFGPQDNISEKYIASL